MGIRSSHTILSVFSQYFDQESVKNSRVDGALPSLDIRGGRFLNRVRNLSCGGMKKIREHPVQRGTGSGGTFGGRVGFSQSGVGFGCFGTFGIGAD